MKKIWHQVNLVLVFWVILAFPLVGKAQQQTLFAPTPLILKIDTKDTDVPNDVIEVVSYVAPTGIITEKFAAATNVFFSLVPAPLAYPSTQMKLTVCGFAKRQTPVATLAKPDGKKSVLTEINTSEEFGYRCFYYVVPVQLEMPLGRYEFTVEYSENLETRRVGYSWLIGYPTQPVLLELPKNTRIAMGFAPNETVTAYIYWNNRSGKTLEYVAQRQITMDANGTRNITLETANPAWRAADFAYVLREYDSEQGSTFFGERRLRGLKDGQTRGEATDETTGNCGSFESRLLERTQATVRSPEKVALRNAPTREQASKDDNIVVVINPGKRLQLLTTMPFCDSRNVAWWKASFENKVGWVPEGQDNTYYLDPLK